MKNRHFIVLLFILAALAALLTGCAQPQAQKKIQIVTAIFPEYDWVRQIVGEDDSVDVRFLVDDGLDPHSFQPTVADMVDAAGCDLLIYGGGESDKWLNKLEATNAGRRVITLLPLLGESAHQEELVEGMQPEDDHDDHGDHDHAEEESLDEHVWLSLRNASLFCQAISDALCDLNPAKADTYRANLIAYQQKLIDLDAQYQQAVSGASKDTIVVCDRFPFRYLVEDYHLNYYAAFPGCSAETGASFETVVFLSDKVRELGLGALLVTESSDGRMAATVAQNAGNGDMPVLTLNAMQSVSAENAKTMDYLSVMTANLAVLEQALS